MFGENLTTSGLDVDGAVVGERWRVGSALLEVTGPRIPCATFAAWMGERGWVRRFTERGRTGAYLAVVEPGFAVGDPVEVVAARSRITVPEVFRAFIGDEGGPDGCWPPASSTRTTTLTERRVARRTPDRPIGQSCPGSTVRAARVNIDQ